MKMAGWMEICGRRWIGGDGGKDIDVGHRWSWVD